MAADLLDSYFPENRVAPYFGWRQNRRPQFVPYAY